MKCIYDLLQKCHKGCPEVECYNYDKVNEGVINNEQPLEMIKFDETDKCHYEDGCRADFFKELTAPYDVKNMQEFIAVIRAEVIDEIKEHYTPCYDCDYCIDENKKYFEKQCEKEKKIRYTKLCEYLEQLKVGGK